MVLNDNKHGALAASLIPLSLLIGCSALYVYMNFDVESEKETTFLALCVASPVLWLWGFFHLTRHYKLSVIWTLLGFLFLPGWALLVWASGHQPRWEQQRIRRFAAKQNRENPESSPAQQAKSGKKAKIPKPRDP